MPHKKQLEIRGADVSHLRQIEDFGGVFSHGGDRKDCLVILRDHAFNFVRLKVWNNPGPPDSDPAGYNDKNHVIEMARRVKRLGMKLLIDFHYSDFWADPNKQNKPKKWQNLGFDELVAGVQDFTADFLVSLKEENIPPDMVQIGNEIDNGMLWDDGKLDGTPEKWDRLAELLKAGIRGVASAAGTTSPIPVMIHKADACKPDKVFEFFDNLIVRYVDFDCIGFSFYPFFHGTFEMLEKTLSLVAEQYGRDIVIVETAWGWTHEHGNKGRHLIDTPAPLSLPFSVDGQRQFLKRLASIVKNIPDHRGKGMFYWEPAFIPVAGAGWKFGEGDEWDNMTLFDFKGNALDSLDVFLDM